MYINTRLFTATRQSKLARLCTTMHAWRLPGLHGIREGIIFFAWGTFKTIRSAASQIRKSIVVRHVVVSVFLVVVLLVVVWSWFSCRGSNAPSGFLLACCSTRRGPDSGGATWLAPIDVPAVTTWTLFLYRGGHGAFLSTGALTGGCQGCPYRPSRRQPTVACRRGLRGDRGPVERWPESTTPIPP